MKIGFPEATLLGSAPDTSHEGSETLAVTSQPWAELGKTKTDSSIDTIRGGRGAWQPTANEETGGPEWFYDSSKTPSQWREPDWNSTVWGATWA